MQRKLPYFAVSTPEYRKNHDTKTATTTLENVRQLKYLGPTVTNQNLIQKEIKSRLNLDNPCYGSVQNLSSSCLL
jgi:hypothetical protein